MTSESIAEKFPRVNETIVQSSIIFISIFATVGLLFGGITQQFKMAYFYFGYMLYYSVPFIIAAFLSTLSMLSSQKNNKEADRISFLAVCFFLTGFVMLVLLASLATQTTMLPSYFTFFPAYPSLLVFEGIAAFVFALGPTIAEWLQARTSKRRGWLLPICVFVFVASLFAMTMYGTNQTSYIAASGSVALPYPANKFESVNVTLLTADQINVEIKGAEGHYLSYAFLNEKNYYLYNDTTTKEKAQMIKYDFGADLSFQATAESTETYYLTMRSEYFLGTNATYAIRVYRTETTVLLYSFFSSIISGAAFLGAIVFKTDANTPPSTEQSTATPNPTKQSVVTPQEPTSTQPVPRARATTVEDDEEDNWRQLYSKVYESKNFFAEKAWESIRFHSVLLSSLVSVTIGALALMHTSEIFLTYLNGVESSLLTLLLVVLPLTMIRLVKKGATNFERECRRMYEQVSILMKLEERFGFMKERKEKKQFPNDEGYFPKEYYDKWASSTDYVHSMMSREDSLYSHMRPIFNIFKVASYGLTFAIIGLTAWHLASYFLHF